MKKVRAGPASPTSTNGTDTYRLTHVVNNFSCKANNYYDFTPSRRTPTIRLAVKRREQVGAVAERIRGNYQNWNVIHLNHCGSTLLKSIISSLMLTTTFSSFLESCSEKKQKQCETEMSPEIQERNEIQMQQTNNIFAGLKAAIAEHSSGGYLRLKDGQSAVVTVLVDQTNPDPAKRTPREEYVDNYAKTSKVWKLRLDCQVDDTKKIFHVRAQDKAEVLALLERGVREIKIARFGSTAQTTKYTFTEVRR